MNWHKENRRKSVILLGQINLFFFQEGLVKWRCIFLCQANRAGLKDCGVVRNVQQAFRLLWTVQCERDNLHVLLGDWGLIEEQSRLLCSLNKASVWPREGWFMINCERLCVTQTEREHLCVSTMGTSQRFWKYFFPWKNTHLWGKTHKPVVYRMLPK